MGPVTAVRTCMIDKYATISGRASRSEYWWFSLVATLVYFAGCAPSIVFTITQLSAAEQSGGQVDPVALTVTMNESLGALIHLPVLIYLFIFTPCWTVTARRFHDRGLSHLWLAPVFLASAFTAVISLWQTVLIFTSGPVAATAAAAPLMQWSQIAGGVFVIGFILMLFVLCRRSKQGANRYGPDPLGGQADAEVFA